jgi:hypothetical protein
MVKAQVSSHKTYNLVQYLKAILCWTSFMIASTTAAIYLTSKQEIFTASTGYTVNAWAAAGDSIIFSTNNTLYALTSGTQASAVAEVANNKDISCYGKYCFTANEYSAYPWTVGTNTMTNTESYPLELQGVSQVVYMRVSIIEETNYFLLAAEGAYGINRFQTGNYDTHTKLEILGTASTDQIAALQAYPGITYAVAAYQRKSYFHCFDIALNLHVFNFDTDSAVGGFVAYNFDTTRNMLGVFTQNSYAIINLLAQVYFYKWDYTGLTASGTNVLYASSPRQSMYTFLVTATQLLVLDHMKDESGPKLYSATNSQVIGMVYSPESANLFLIYTSKVERYSLTFDYFGDCHPNCYECTQPLSQYYCKECIPGITASSTKCVPTPLQLSATFSSDNQLTTKFGQAWIYVVIVLSAMFLVGVLMYCVYQGVMQTILEEEMNQKMKESEEEEQKKLNGNKPAPTSSTNSALVTDRALNSQEPPIKNMPEKTEPSMKDVSKPSQP